MRVTRLPTAEVEEMSMQSFSIAVREEDGKPPPAVTAA